MLHNFGKVLLVQSTISLESTLNKYLSIWNDLGSWTDTFKPISSAEVLFSFPKLVSSFNETVVAKCPRSFFLSSRKCCWHRMKIPVLLQSLDAKAHYIIVLTRNVSFGLFEWLWTMSTSWLGTIKKVYRSQRSAKNHTFPRGLAFCSIEKVLQDHFVYDS